MTNYNIILKKKKKKYLRRYILSSYLAVIINNYTSGIGFKIFSQLVYLNVKLNPKNKKYKHNLFLSKFFIEIMPFANTNKSKRPSRQGKQKPHVGERAREVLQQIDENNPTIKAFMQYNTELVEKQDRYERIVKLSRDITIESKRIIFLLHNSNLDM